MENKKYSQYKGVTYNKKYGKWVASIKLGKITKFLGHYDNETLAYQARKAAEEKYKNIYKKYTKSKKKLHNDIVNNYLKGDTRLSISEKYNLTIYHVTEILRNNDVEIRDLRSPKVSEAEKNKIVNLYKIKNQTIKKIAKTLKRSKRIVTRVLKENKVKMKTTRKHIFKDENFLKKIDEPWKAYFLGLLWADGNISHHLDSYAIRIALIESDAQIVLTQLHKKIFKTKVRLEKVKGGKVNILGNLCNKKDQLLFRINSKPIFEDLENLGCTQKKSLTIDYPKNMPDEFFWDFLRGYFDGDGCISRSFRMISSLSLCESIQKKLMKFKIKSYLYQNGKVYELAVHKKLDKMTIFNNFYKDADIFLPRKYLTFKKLFEHTVKKNTN